MVIQKDNKIVSAYTFFKNRIPGLSKLGATLKWGIRNKEYDIKNNGKMTTFTAAMLQCQILSSSHGCEGYYVK